MWLKHTLTDTLGQESWIHSLTDSCKNFGEWGCYLCPEQCNRSFTCSPFAEDSFLGFPESDYSRWFYHQWNLSVSESENSVALCDPYIWRHNQHDFSTSVRQLCLHLECKHNREVRRKQSWRKTEQMGLWQECLWSHTKHSYLQIFF